MIELVPYNTPPGKCPDCKGSGKCDCGQCPNGICVTCQGTGEFGPLYLEEDDD